MANYNIDIIKLLIEHTENINIYCKITPLLCAIKYNNTEVVREILKHRPNLSIVDHNYNNALHHCIINFNFELGLELLDYITKTKQYKCLNNYNKNKNNILSLTIEHISNLKNIDNYLEITFLENLIHILKNNLLDNVCLLKTALLHFDKSIIQEIINRYYLKDNILDIEKIRQSNYNNTPLIHNIQNLDFYLHKENKITSKILRIHENIEFLLNIYRQYFNKYNIIEIILEENKDKEENIYITNYFEKSEQNIKLIQENLPVYYYYLDCISYKDFNKLTKIIDFNICDDLIKNICKYT
jgi:hypothetical protein